MKINVIIVSILLFTLKVFSQGNYVFEKEAFEFLHKSEIAKKNTFKSVCYYPFYKNPINKGQCKKMEVYDSTGVLLKEIYNPNSNKEYISNTFIYDEYRRLVAIENHLSGEKEIFSIVHINYNQFNQIRSMTKEIVNSERKSDTLLYFYTSTGLFDYKVWSHRPDIKTFIHYNQCGNIEYVESKMLDANSVRLDSNDCIIFFSIKKIEEDMGYHNLINNNFCQNVSDYSVYKHGNIFSMYHKINEYDINHNLIRSVLKKSKGPSIKSCEKRLKIINIREFKYNNDGLEIFKITKNAKGKVQNILYTEYLYF